MKIIKLSLAIVACLTTCTLQAQLLKRLGQRGENIAVDAAGRIAEKKVDQQINQTQTKSKSAGNSDNTISQDTTQKTQTSFTSFSKFDFIPGEKIQLFTDFSTDPVGELPASFNASGKGEVRTINNHEGKWLRLFQNTTYLAGNKTNFGENYTIEFDIIYNFIPGSDNYVLPGWNFGLFSSNGGDPTGNEFLKYRAETNAVDVRFEFSSYVMSRMESYLKRTSTFRSDKLQVGRPSDEYNKLRHISVQVQKSRFRLWIDQNKIYDVPRAVNPMPLLNGIYFTVEGSNYKDEKVGLFISNLKIATGLPSTNKLLDEGIFTTTGIQFAVNSAAIQAPSYPVLKEVATILKENQQMRIRITGHTDADGNANSNQKLSEQRAAAVKAALINEFGIEGSRIETTGKGQSQPLSKENTTQAKAMNRRVEFKRF